jgi:hypothetical protein
MTKIVDWNPDNGDAPQGDVCIFRLPQTIDLSKATDAKEMPYRDNKLILAEGEVTGHHHAIWNPQPTMFRPDEGSGGAVVPDLLAQLLNKPMGKIAGVAKMFNSPSIISKLVAMGELTVSTLAIGILEVTGAPMVLRHDEHDGIRIPVGTYYVGGQREFNAALERRIAD